MQETKGNFKGIFVDNRLKVKEEKDLFIYSQD